MFSIARMYPWGMFFLVMAFLFAIETLKGELIGAGNSLYSSNDILDAENGFVVNVSKVFMKPGVYPRFW